MKLTDYINESLINEGKETNIHSGSVDVDKLTSKLTYLKKDLDGIKGDVDFIIKDYGKGKSGVDPYAVYVYQDGKELAFKGTIPQLPKGGKISDNFK